MKKFNPLPKVKARKFIKMENQVIDLQTVYNNMLSMEQRLNALQIENNNLRANQNMQQNAPQQASDIFRIPDPIKSLPSFDGKKKQASAWVQTVRRTLEMFRNRVPAETLSMYEQCIINKVEGDARDTLCSNGNPQTFEEAASILLGSFGDRNTIATYQTQIWNMKMTDSLHNYYRKSKEIMVNIKSLAKENEIYRTKWDAINEFIEQECLAAFINGLHKPYFGYAQTAQPENLEAAYAFLCRFQCAEQTKKQTNQLPNSTHPQYTNKNHNFRQNKPFGNPQQKSDRSKITPMDVDPSLRSRQGKLFNHDSEPVEENLDNQEQENSDSESEYETNFQIDIHNKPSK